MAPPRPRPASPRVLALALAAAALAGPAAAPAAATGRQHPHIDRSWALQRALVASAPTPRVPGASAASASAPPAWCGRVRRTDDRRAATFRGMRTVKLLYAVPRGRRMRFAHFAALLQADVAQITTFMAQQTGWARTIRFDLGTSCGPRWADIQLVRLRYRARHYLVREQGELVPAVDPGTPLWREVRRATRGERGHDFLVYADGLNPIARGEQPWAWGQTDRLVDDARPGAENRNNRAGRIAAIFGPDRGLPPLRPTGFAATMALHETMHMLGAVQNGAPHSTRAGHCTDGGDIMCYDDGGPRGRAYRSDLCPELTGELDALLDCGHDDYLSVHPSPGTYLATHWNVFSSRFLVPCGSARLAGACGQAPWSADTPLSRAAVAGPAVATDLLGPGGVVLGTLHLALDVGDTDARASLQTGPLTLPEGIWRLHACLRLDQDGSAPWSSCVDRAADSGVPWLAPFDVSVGRPSAGGGPSAVTGTLELQLRGPDGTWTTHAAAGADHPVGVPAV